MLRVSTVNFRLDCAFTQFDPGLHCPQVDSSAAKHSVSKCRWSRGESIDTQAELDFIVMCALTPSAVRTKPKKKTTSAELDFPRYQKGLNNSLKAKKNKKKKKKTKKKKKNEEVREVFLRPKHGT